MNDPEKHTRYQTQYKPNDFFWGIGIENETYLQFTKPKTHTVKSIYNNHKPERYSVNYFSGLNPEYNDILKALFPISNSAYALAALIDNDPEDIQRYDIPCYMNSHTLQKTDLSGNHQTTYEKNPKPNLKFKGQTIHDFLLIVNPKIFKDKYKVNYIYDGDTVEFMTQNFYKTTVKQNVTELITEKTNYLEAINEVFKKYNIFTEYGPLIYPLRNEPFVSFLTNINNIAIFNNGTIHLNFTMPTQLDGNSRPLNPSKFVMDHKSAIRYIQYLEPLIIPLYGTSDPFSAVSLHYSKASQRCAVSRYIGIGTYNTETMETGKILTIDTKDALASNKDYWWYTQYTKTTHYNPLQKIGVDINFNKHGTHGIEIRFLDWFPEIMLEPLMIFFVNVMDYSLQNGLPEDPTICPIWNGLVVKMLQLGKTAILSSDECNMYTKLFNLDKPNWLSCLPKSQQNDNITIGMMYEKIVKHLKYVNGPCRKCML
jgi:hypothetical protein